MTEKSRFDPSRLKVLTVSNHRALGRAIEIMLKAVGYGTVVVVEPKDVCARAGELKPDAILFTSDFLASPIQEKLEVGCPCKKKDICQKAQLMMLLKKPNEETVLTSKEMGFNNIIFADASIDKMYRALERAYLQFHGI